MNKDKIIYWTTTAVISIMMMLSAYQYLNNTQIKDAFIHLGFPAYFRIELALAKIVGAMVLLIPLVPARIKEWAYAGFGITFISAAIAHFHNADPVPVVVAPGVFLAILIFSNLYFYKLKKAAKIEIAI